MRDIRDDIVVFDSSGKFVKRCRTTSIQRFIRSIEDPEVRRLAQRTYTKNKPMRPAYVDYLAIEELKRRAARLDVPPIETRENKLLRASMEPVKFDNEFQVRDHFSRWIEVFEPGLMLYRSPDGRRGVEFKCDAGRIDILAIDQRGGFVVIEVKFGNASKERGLGQVLRYMAWVRANLATEGQGVRGIVLVDKVTDTLKLAFTEVKEVQLVEYLHSLGLMWHTP